MYKGPLKRSFSIKGKHTTLDKSLRPSVHWVEKLPGVTKVVLGFSKACRHRYSPGIIRYRNDVDGGIKANGYSGNGVMDLFIRISPIEERESIKTKIAKKFSYK